MRPVTGSVWLSKYLSHLTEMKQRMDFCSDGTKCSCLDFDEDAINFGFYLSPAEGTQVQNQIDGDTESSSPISIACVLGRRATKSLSAEEN